MYAVANYITQSWATDRKFRTAETATRWLNQKAKSLPGYGWAVYELTDAGELGRIVELDEVEWAEEVA